MSSSRMPGKALLPLCGVPIAVLAGLRAGRDGAFVRLAVSDDATDDVLAEAASQHGLAVVRASLDDPLARFVVATSDLAERDLVVRLTADNVVPDAALVSEIVAESIRLDAAYIRTNHPSDGLPYGVAVEVMTVKSLRAADRAARDHFDREHVTPWLRENVGDATFDRYARPDRWSHLRTTIDCFTDYHRAARAFDGAADPVGVDWRELCERFGALSDAPRGRVPTTTVGGYPQSSLVLGTAQLGLPYGVANTDGLPSDSDAREILQTAVAHGVTHFDTARAYGSAEDRIGRYLDEGHRSEVRVVTKLRPLDDVAADATRSELVAWVDASLFRSLAALGGRSVDTLLLHRAADHGRGGGAVWARLLEHRERGLVGRLGVSAGTPAEALDALADPAVSYIQLPFNLLDDRWSEVADVAPSRPGVTLVARSALLQGLLTGDVDEAGWPANEGVHVRDLMSRLDRLVRTFARDDLVDLCLSYVRAQPWLHAVVVGAERADQVRDLFERFQRPPLTPDECAAVRNALPAIPADLLDPSRWMMNR